MDIRLFIQLAWESPLYYFSWVFTVVVSIILHELAHGWTAIKLGDDTPRRENRMTLDPLVHMGSYALIMLFLLGIAWGQMPINPNRLRGRYASAAVAAAGPLMNIVLGIFMLTLLAFLVARNMIPVSTFGNNIYLFMVVFGQANIALALFNLIPLPPFDGAAIVANFSRTYDDLIRNPAHQGVFWVIFLLIFFLGGSIFMFGSKLSLRYLDLVLKILG